ncbi:hypothetical protein [Streptomyces halstedii]|uniref:PH domain-containing protein n=1 Tax=Streptomyces halstedii TaxID=1944 RepID=A0A6N9TZC9_STRHA|nr:hypothetical protein [Streptomyces halstedii]NEA16767.1 hypothetical protein [Streptomyces halstedii]
MSGLSVRGVFASRKRDGSVHLRRKGTVVFGWLTMLLLSPVLILLGLAEVEEKGFHGIGALLVIGCLDAMVTRVGIRCRVILDPGGTVRDVSPLLVTSIPIREIHSVACVHNGLMIELPSGGHGVWSFAPSLIGGRSARAARKVIAGWLAETRETLPAEGAGEGGARRVYVTLPDVFFLLGPFVAPLLV